MPTTTEPPKPAPGEINIKDLPNTRGGDRTPMPASLLAAVNAEAGKSPATPTAIAPPDPPSDTPPVKETPPAQPKREIEPVKPAATPAQEPAKGKKEGIEAVREALERAQKRASELEGSLTATAKEKADAFAKLAELESKAAKYESDIEKEYKPRLVKLEQVEKEMQRTREILKIKAYQETDEFHNQFVKPLADTRLEVAELLGELIVSDGENQRAATVQDFDEILAAKSLNEAAVIARQKFGPDISQQVVNYRTKIRSLERSRQEAVKNAALRAEEYEKQTQEQHHRANQAFRERLLSEANKLISTDDLLAVPDDDAELRNSLIEGQTLADRLLNGDQNLTPEQFVTEIAKGRKAIVGGKVLQTKLARANAQIATLQDQLKAYQASEPEVRARNGGGGGPAVTNSQEARNTLLAAAQAAAVQR